jgi:hypothetical protein
VIRHARHLGLANATTALALVVAMIESSLRRLPVSRARRSLRRGTRHDLAWRPAKALPAIAGLTDPEHDLAPRTSLETKLLVVVHRLLARGRKTCSGPPASSIVCSKPASIG